MSAATPIVRAEGLRKTFPSPGGDLVVLDEVEFDLEAGEAVAITGPSGSGKSTLLHLLGTLERPTAGRVEIAGRDPFALADAELAAFRSRTIGFVFQDHHLLPQYTVLENTVLPALAQRGDLAAARGRAEGLLARVGLGERLHHRPAALSGGERQRAAVARALLHRPTVLLCDEPTGNLDPESATRVVELLFALHREREGVLVVVTHNLELAARFEHRLQVVRGRCVEAASGRA